jgi:class 3 adenylate cyclase
MARGSNDRDPQTRGNLVADVVGYSRLAGADEDRTLARLRALRSDRTESQFLFCCG